MKRCLLLLGLMLLLTGLPSQSEGGTSLAINHAVFESDSMVLRGSNFDSFGEIEVWIGDICLTCSGSTACVASPDTITCDLTGTPPASSGGTWKVWVSACNAPKCQDGIHLSIPVALAACNPGDFVECYTGPAGTSGVGVCVSGVRTCTDGTWGTCAGEVAPADEICHDGLDNDCDGFFDLEDTDCCLDLDGDGYGVGPYCLGLDCDDEAPEIPGAPCDGPDSDGCEEGVWECAGDVPQCTDATGDNIEICNGIDDDCDGFPDEGGDLCDDGLLCTIDTCTSGHCVNHLSSSSCLIGGVCYGNGQPNPGNSCQICDPSFSQNAWRLVTGACLIDGVCYSSGQPNPDNLCQVCDPSGSRFAWNPRNCSDSDACTNDSCDPNSGCVHDLITCDDGISCTYDICNSSTGSCQHQDACTGGQTYTCSSFPSTSTCFSEYQCNYSTGQCTTSNCCF